LEGDLLGIIARRLPTPMKASGKLALACASEFHKAGLGTDFRTMIGTMATTTAKITHQRHGFTLAEESHPLATWLCDPHIQNISAQQDLIEDRYTLNNKICLEVWIASRLPCHSANGTGVWIRFS